MGVRVYKEVSCFKRFYALLTKLKASELLRFFLINNGHRICYLLTDKKIPFTVKDVTMTPIGIELR